MSDTDDYILSQIKHWVWSGFYRLGEVQNMIDDILDEDADEPMLRNSVKQEFAAKATAEVSWPDQTDCDRLDTAFASLIATGVIALTNAGYTMSDGLSDVGETLQNEGRANIKGYCFYHGQDVERAIDGGGLTIAFGDLDDDQAKKPAIGKIVRERLESEGLEVSWNGDSETRLKIPLFDWKRRIK